MRIRLAATLIVAIMRVECRFCSRRRRIRPPSRTRTASISTRRGHRPTRSPATARSTGTRIRATAVITRNATSAMAPTARGRATRPASRIRLKTMSYAEFLEVVVNGRQNVGAAQQQVMPSFGVNSNVMCYLDDIYIYLAGARARRARSGATGKARGEAASLRQGRSGLSRRAEVARRTRRREQTR